MPPEFTNNGMMTPKNDVFSLGVIIFHMMAGEKGYNDYCDLRSGQGFSEKNRQEFIESVRIFVCPFLFHRCHFLAFYIHAYLYIYTYLYFYCNFTGTRVLEKEDAGN